MTNGSSDPRRLRGLELARAKHQRFVRITEDTWIVPSATSAMHAYVVDVSDMSCTCPDFADTGRRCKHVWAAAYLANRVTFLDGMRVAPPPIVGDAVSACAAKLPGES